MIAEVKNSTSVGNIQARVESTSVDFATSLDRLFEAERVVIRKRIDSETQFAPFRYLTDSMLTFICAEKQRLALTDETRNVRNSTGEIITGYCHHYGSLDDEYHPQCFEPFDVKGFWMPESEGEYFSVLSSNDSCPLVRKGVTGKEILFLIHPKSEALFSPLIEKFKHNQVVVSALALSSFRTLLIAIQGSTCLPQYAFVKVSLNETIGGAGRILTHKECALSVANSFILQKKASSLYFMNEGCSFVPDASLINVHYEKARDERAGMIYRAIPEMLVDSTSKEYVIPLFSLFGLKNRPLLDSLIKQSKKLPTDFVKDCVLKPFAELYIDLLYNKNISIEAHGQNIVLNIDTKDPENLKIVFMYRDMGGVNALLAKKDKERLPESLNKDHYFYFDSHYKDAADVLEGFTRKVLFNLTKQFFKSETYFHEDTSFALWKQAMIKKGFAANWTLSGKESDEHQKDFTKETFYRYGFFEKIFGSILLEEMNRQGIFIVIGDYQPELSSKYFAEKLDTPDDPYATCIEIEWFKNLILKTYPLYYSVMNGNGI